MKCGHYGCLRASAHPGSHVIKDQKWADALDALGRPDTEADWQDALLRVLVQRVNNEEVGGDAEA